MPFGTGSSIQAVHIPQVIGVVHLILMDVTTAETTFEAQGSLSRNSDTLGGILIVIAGEIDKICERTAGIEEACQTAATEGAQISSLVTMRAIHSLAVVNPARSVSTRSNIYLFLCTAA